MAKIMIAMSGGVDSSLTAALLHEAGHDVTGVTMHLWEGDDEHLYESQCCSLEMTEGARRVCAQLGVPYYVFNYQREFRRNVIEYFMSEYAHGYTPNPCLACNRDLKFRFLLERAQVLGFDYLATGHYARIRTVDSQGSGVRGQGSGVRSQRIGRQGDKETRRPKTEDRRSQIEDRSSILHPPSSILHPSSQPAPCATLVPHPPSPAARYELLRAVDQAKDQSYVLYMLQQPELARLLFPLGGYTKAQVRAMAVERGLATADRPESQDICFIPDNDYRRFLHEEQPESIRPGPIVDLQGREIGRHDGLPLYTIGQRKGLGIAVGQPLYVTELDVARNALIVGPREALERRTLDATRVTFVDGGWPDAPFDCLAQIRSHAAPAEAHVTPGERGSIRLAFARPQRAVTPGQAVVLYDGERVLGGGRIAA